MGRFKHRFILPWPVSSSVTLESRLPDSNQGLAELIDSTLLNYVISVAIYTLREGGASERLKIAWIAETAFLGFNERDNPPSHASLEQDCRD